MNRNLIVFICMVFVGRLIGQDSSNVISQLESQIIIGLEENGNCDLNDLEKAISHFKIANDSIKLNAFLSKVFDIDPRGLKLNFLQILIKSSMESISFLNSENRIKLEKYYSTLRSRTNSFLITHQELLLLKAKINYKEGNTRFTYSCLSEVIKLYDSRVRSNDFLFEKNNSPNLEIRPYKLAHEAFILFVRYLPVDDPRFKIFAKGNKYMGYRNEQDRLGCEIINRKLSIAGYEQIHCEDKWIRDNNYFDPKNVTRRDSLEAKEREKWDWKKKE